MESLTGPGCKGKGCMAAHPESPRRRAISLGRGARFKEEKIRGGTSAFLQSSGCGFSQKQVYVWIGTTY